MMTRTSSGDDLDPLERELGHGAEPRHAGERPQAAGDGQHGEGEDPERAAGDAHRRKSTRRQSAPEDRGAARPGATVVASAGPGDARYRTPSPSSALTRNHVPKTSPRPTTRTRL